MDEATLALAALEGAALLVFGGLYLRGRRRPPAPPPALGHAHSRWKRGADGIYSCADCGDRFMDGKPK